MDSNSYPNFGTLLCRKHVIFYISCLPLVVDPAEELAVPVVAAVDQGAVALRAEQTLFMPRAVRKPHHESRKIKLYHSQTWKRCLTDVKLESTLKGKLLLLLKSINQALKQVVST